MKSALLGLLSIALLVSAARSQISFEAGVDYTSSSEPEGLALGDFNGDGELDLAVTASGPDKILIRMNQGDGSFGNSTSVLVTANSGPHGIVAVNLDSDGDVDLAVSLKNSNAVRFLINDGAGSFSSGPVYAVGSSPHAMASGDVNNDGQADLVVSNLNGDSITVLRSNPGGTFTLNTYPTGTKPRKIGLGDFTSDGWLDIAVASRDSKRVDVFRNLGDTGTAGTFVKLMNLTTTPLDPTGLVAVDLDGNGEVDIATSASDSSDNGWVCVFLNDGGANFGARSDYALSGQAAYSLVAADFDRDGTLDLASANVITSDVSTVRGTGGGAFAAADLWPVGTAPGGLAVGDLDYSQSPDLVTSNEGSDSATVLINEDTCVGQFTSYCTAGTSASGCQAILGGTGIPSASATSGFSLTAVGVEGNKPGIFFWGTNGRKATPWGSSSSYFCAVSPVYRGALLLGTGTNGVCDGNFSFDLNERWTVKPWQNPGIGAVVQAQLWYRDPLSTSNRTTSLSDALEFCVGP